ncbi:hypothetical protein ACFRCX_28845 [Streptomyces sp. NPDC056652]|uniref:hypothetical protein n=1 Tax=Streptomyces sp. NPDC056652 TaxID=3345893 RepID=UPI00368D27BE
MASTSTKIPSAWLCGTLWWLRPNPPLDAGEPDADAWLTINTGGPGNSENVATTTVEMASAVR